MQTATSSTAHSVADLLAMAKVLQESGHFSVLRNLVDSSSFIPTGKLPENPEDLINCIYVDVETTGKEVDDEIIQLSMIKATVNRVDGGIVAISNMYNRYHEPRKAISEEITALTGITAETVEGHSIDESEVADFIQDADLMVAHEATFDRAMMENNLPLVTTLIKSKSWACSRMDIPWKDLGYSNAKQEYLVFKAGFSYQAHRADLDTLALVQLMDSALNAEGGEPFKPMKLLYDNAMKSTCKIWALAAPFSAKDALKARGYFWSDGTKGDHKAWWIVLDESQEKLERDWLNREVYGRPVDVSVEYFDAKTRYSDPLSPRPIKSPSFI